MYTSIRPGQIWLDTDGKRIQAHGGSLLMADGTCYWYGENKEKTVPGSGIWHWGVRLYSSKDLYNWKDEGIILPPDTEDPSSPIHPSSCMDRPHILYHEKDKRYVMWVKIMEKDGTQSMTVAVSDTLKGPFRIVDHFRPVGLSSGDFDLVKRPDGSACILFEEVHTSLIVADLTPDYLHTTGQYTRHMERPYPPYVREAPACFSADGRWFLFTSGTTGYLPNRSEVAAAPDLHGPWEVLGDPHIGDPRHNSFFSQITSVFHVPGTRLYIALADRWLTDIVGRDDIRAEEWFATLFSPDTTAAEKKEAEHLIHTASAENTSLADYVWLPVEWEDGKPVLRWHDEWKIEDYL